MKQMLLPAVVCAGVMFGGATTASAQGIYIGPGGAGPDYGYYPPPPPPPRYYGPPPRYYGGGPAFRIDRGEAVRIARRNGLERIYDVDRSGPNWVVRGENYRGRDLSVWVNSYNGDVSISRR
ncbi:hypothetical protein [Flaviflagellibacter deserti]|uniref:PepSY domain-containing protein n=1 Tax=Flaviflagellibacter deserti TaxID=2267266 RepID=A0ABV9YWJ4_9HYPH